MATIAGSTRAGTPERALNRRAVAAAVIGNALEWYDFTVFSFMAVVIAGCYFP